MSGAVSSIHSGWRRAQTTSGVHRLAVYVQGSEYMRFEKDNHTQLLSVSDTKNVRINSRNYTQTSGDASGVQIKPNQSVSSVDPGTTDVSITGLEVSPRFASAISGGNLVAIKADPVLKGTTGDVAGQVVGVQVNIDFGTSGSRTITGDIAAFEAFLAIPSSGMTYSALVSFLRVRAVNVRSWDQFLNVDDENTGVTTSADPSASTNDRWIPCKIGTDQYYLRLYD